MASSAHCTKHWMRRRAMLPLQRRPRPRAWSPQVPTSMDDGSRMSTLDEAGAWSKQPDHVVWIGLLEPTMDMLRQVQVQFDLHPLAIEDAGKAHQRPKLDQYGNGVFIVARTAQLVGRTDRLRRDPPVCRARAMSFRSATAPRCPTRRCASAARPAQPPCRTGRITSSTPSSTSSSTTTCRCWRRSTPKPRRSRIRCLSGSSSKGEIERLYLLRRDLLRLRNAVVPLVEVCRKLEHAEVIAIDAEHAAALPGRDGPRPARAGGDRRPSRGLGLRV